MAWEFSGRFRAEGTLVSNRFIDELMAGASGEYVKVYLYLLRHQDKAPGLAQVAEALHYTEGDVGRALAYWEKAGVLCQAGGQPEGRQKEGVERQKEEEKLPVLPPRSKDGVSRLSGDEEFAQLLYIAQKYVNKVFTQRECQVFA